MTSLRTLTRRARALENYAKKALKPRVYVSIAPFCTHVTLAVRRMSTTGRVSRPTAATTSSLWRGSLLSSLWSPRRTFFTSSRGARASSGGAYEEVRREITKDQDGTQVTVSVKERIEHAESDQTKNEQALADDLDGLPLHKQPFTWMDWARGIWVLWALWIMWKGTEELSCLKSSFFVSLRACVSAGLCLTLYASS